MKTNNTLKIKQYIEGYLWVFRALLNYYSQYIAKAKAINDYPSSPSVCKDAASHLLDKMAAMFDENGVDAGPPVLALAP